VSDRRFDWLRIVSLALAVAGLLVAGMIERKSEGQKLPSFMAWTCGGALDCDKVLASPFAKPFYLPPFEVPISLAAIGKAYFMALGVWLLLVGRLPGRLHHAWAIPSLMGLGGVLGSVAMIYILARVLRAWCGLCLLTHAIDLALVLGIWILWIAGRKAVAPVEPAAQAAVAPTGSHLWKIPTLALLAGLAAGLAQLRTSQTAEAVRMVALAGREYDAVTNDDEYRKFLFDKAKKVEIPIDPDDPASGPADAPHTLVIFADFQCPHCAEFASLVPKIQKALNDPMRVVFKYFPLSHKCNPGRPALVGFDPYDIGCDVAAAAEAARQLGGNEAFWKAHDLLLADHNRLRGLKYQGLAKELGLDPEAFDRLRQDPKVMEHVRRAATQGAKVGVWTTPAIFLDGRRIQTPWKNTYSRETQKRVMDVQQSILYWKKLLTWSALAEAPATRPAEPAATATEQADRVTQPAHADAPAGSP
jgi:protein-disulfide isomerase/uncharacterized membrane protein